MAMNDGFENARQVGQYLLLEKVGVGAMATVYKAINMETPCIVALKLLHEQFADNPLIYRRLEREAKIIQALEHPNIIKIIELGQENGRPFLAMPFISGGSLVEYFEPPYSFSLEASLKLLEDLCSAIDYAHSRGVIHRDFKLENVLLNDEGKPILTDFGLAQSVGMMRLTATGKLMGTPLYMAPELLNSNNEYFDYRSDLYSLGVMAFLMLTGDFPFTGTDILQIALKHRSEMPPLPSSLNPSIPTEMDAILLKALAKNPDKRYQSASDFIRELQAVRQAKVAGTRLDSFAMPKLDSISTEFNVDVLASETAFGRDTIHIVNLPPRADHSIKATKSRRIKAILLVLPMLGLFGLFMLKLNPANSFQSGTPTSVSTAPSIQATELHDQIVRVNESLVLGLSMQLTIQPTAEFTSTEAYPSQLANSNDTNSVTMSHENTASPTSVNTVIPSNTNGSLRNPTSTIAATSTPAPSNTSVANTALPVNTVIPNTPVPLNTQIPASNTAVSQPTNPPANNSGVLEPLTNIVEPVLEPITNNVNSGGENGNNQDESQCLLSLGC